MPSQNKITIDEFGQVHIHDLSARRGPRVLLTPAEVLKLCRAYEKHIAARKTLRKD